MRNITAPNIEETMVIRVDERDVLVCSVEFKGLKTVVGGKYWPSREPWEGRTFSLGQVVTVVAEKVRIM